MKGMGGPEVNAIHLLPVQEVDLSRIRQSPPGLVLVIGQASTMRTAFLEWLVGIMSHDEHIRLSVIALPDSFSAPSEYLVPVPARGDRLLSGLRYALDSDPDQIVLDLVDCQAEPDLSRLATDAARWGVGVWAGIQGSDPFRTITRFSGARPDHMEPLASGALKGIIRLREMPRLCPACAKVPEDARIREALKDLLGSAHSGALIRGPGCGLCSFGIDGFEALVEICPIPSSPPGDMTRHYWDGLREDWLRSGGVNHLRHALWHIGLGRADLAGLRRVFGGIEAPPEAIKTLSRQVQDDLAATTEDDVS